MQGLYGPYTIAERVVQKIWLRRDFATTGARLVDGRKLEIRSPGTWNLLGGPDFRAACLMVDGQPVTGDIEVHFHVSDWRAHGHAADRAYGKVALHVVMFPPAEGERGAIHGDGREIPTLVLLPLLHRSLEEYASDDALENITARDATARIAELLTLPAGELQQLLRRKGKARWDLKKHFATLRIKKLGWSSAAHHTVLEILGYRQNRAAMLAVATEHPLEEWAGGLALDEIFSERAGQWQLQGVRPANHPRVRLKQYQRWVTARPDWPETLAFWSRSDLAADGGRNAARSLRLQGSDDRTSTMTARKQWQLSRCRERLAQDIMDNSVGGSRLDTLICDGFLPLAAAATGHEHWPVWFHWYMGDVPLEVRRALRETGIAGRNAPPLCHGWGQGLLGWMLDRDARASG